VTTRRLGPLVPSSRTVPEVDCYRRVPPHGTVPAARMRLAATTGADEARMLDRHVLPAPGDLATVRPDVVVTSNPPARHAAVRVLDGTAPPAGPEDGARDR
jgi:maleate cis-trans isomerase